MPDLRSGSQRPTLLHEPPDCADWSISDLAVDYAAEVGYVLDDWQRWLVRWAFVRNTAGLWAARDYGIEVPRQNGKNVVLEVIEVVALFALGEDLVIHSAHRTDVSHEHFLSLKAHIEETPDLMAQMPNRPNNGFITANGKESIELANGKRLLFKSRQSGSGRGPRPKRLIFDEALILSTSAVGDMAPGMSAQRNPQIVFASSPPKHDSAMLHALRKRATDPEDDDRLFYAAWNNHPDTDPDDTEALYWVNPSLGYGRMTEQSLKANRRLMELGDYLREHVGIPEAPIDPNQSAIPLDRWAELIDADAKPEPATVRLALDCPPDRTSASFAVAGKLANGLLFGERRDHLQPERMGQLVSRAKELCDGHGTSLIIPPGSPALAWKSELLAAGVPLDEMTPAEYAAACGYISTAIAEGKFRHTGQPELTNAITGLSTRVTGDVEVWARRKSTVNIAPFVALTCALARVPESTKKRELFLAVT